MFYFAKVESNQIISEIIVVAESDCGNLQFPESETFGQSFLASLGKGGTWLQYSTTREFRKNPASIGGQYIINANVFVYPQPYPSWILDSNNDWQAPVSKPSESGWWEWNEAEQKWQR
jgi:hypothetical protein